MTDGKWTTARVKHAIRWGSQSQVRTGKNSDDIELTITAMDLLHERGVAGYCIVSSDSDFTPLVMRLRESGKLVIGFGEKKSPAAFVEACDSFETVGAIEHGHECLRRDGREAGRPAHEKAKSHDHGRETPCGHEHEGEAPNQRQGAKGVPRSRDQGRNGCEDQRGVVPDLGAWNADPEDSSPISSIATLGTGL